MRLYHLSRGTRRNRLVALPLRLGLARHSRAEEGGLQRQLKAEAHGGACHRQELGPIFCISTARRTKCVA
jgi:hypothetical protein